MHTPLPRLRTLALALALIAAATGCQTPPRPAGTATAVAAPDPDAEVEAVSLLGRPLYPPPLPEEARAERQAQLDEARRGPWESPAEGCIWTGRRLAYLGRFRDALAVFRGGQAAWPEDARFLRHLGHRLITLRRFPEAERALERAAELEAGRPDRVEPDGQPNARGVPLSTLQSNIHYHLGLARYLQGDFEGALRAYADYRQVSDDDDGEVAVDHWTWMALSRLGRHDEAAAVVADVRADMDIALNHGYHRLCLLYRGELSPEELLEEAIGGGEDPGVDDATVAYGVGNWHWVHDRRGEAVAIWRRVLAGRAWHAFGHVAAEAELSRLVGPRGEPAHR